MKCFFNLGKRAFTFAEVMIATGLLGGLGLFTLSLNKSQSTDQKFSATSLAMESLYQKIYLNMEDPSVCNLTFQGITGNIANGTAIDKVYDRQGNVFIQLSPPPKKGHKDTRGLVEIESMELANLSTVSGQRAAEVELAITFKKLSRELASSSGGTERKITYTIPLQIILNSSGTSFDSCPSPESDAKQKALCEDFFGTWDSGSKKCKLPFYGKSCQPVNGKKQGVQQVTIVNQNNIQFGCENAHKD